ncbi:MAG: tRNA uridine-5-carboxymethylaminomethyl(34) synthesis GTPase MnmE [Arenibacterium sp.]
MDTIFALATAPGKSGVAVIRVSGDLAFDAAYRICGTRPGQRGMRVVTFRDGEMELDQGLLLSFKAPASFTGQDIVEFQLHGSIAIVKAVLLALGAIDGLRLAEPGEFTRRALENGKLDLAQVEGLADLIESETEAQRRQAQRVFTGALGQKVEAWRSKLIRAAALIEATIDFADEDVPEDVAPEVGVLLQDVRDELQQETDGIAVSERIRSGFEVAIVGAPNVGKSTLLNALAGRDAAITSEVAGTTRDVIEVRMDLRGLPVTLLDTAGVRDTDDLVENIGVARAKVRAEAADLRVFLVEKGGEPVLEPKKGDLVIVAKADLHLSETNAVSGKTGRGIDRLVDSIAEILSDRSAEAGVATRDRHRISMRQAINALDESVQILASGPDQYDIAAFAMRRAIAALESVVGRVDVENLLDEIFASFCLGK